MNAPGSIAHAPGAILSLSFRYPPGAVLCPHRIGLIPRHIPGFPGHVFFPGPRIGEADVL